MDATARGLAASALHPGTSKAPPAPFNVLALAGNASVTVQWRARHGGMVSSYTVTLSPGGASVTVPATSVRGSATITGLTNGQEYTASVVANGPGGSSLASAASNSVTPTALPSSVLPVTRALEFWWSARQVASPPANGAALTSLTDMSGNGYNAAGSGTGSGGTWLANWSNSKPAVSLDGTGQRYDTLASKLYAGMRSSKATIYVAYSVAANPNTFSNTGGRVVSAEGTSSTVVQNLGGFALGAGSTGSQGNAEIYNESAGYSTASFAGPNFSLATPHYASITRPGGLRFDGSAVSGTIDPVLDFEASGPWTFGAQYANNFNKALQGAIAEIAIFCDVHTPSEITAMEAYLAGAM